MTKIKYKKYKTLYLPEAIVKAVVLHHKFRLEEYSEVRLDICFDWISNIIQKSSLNRDADEKYNLYAPMASKYLKLRYKNRYKIHKNFLVNNSILFKDKAYEGHASSMYIQTNLVYDKIILSFKNDLSNNYINNLDIYSPYCVSNDIEIQLTESVNTNNIGFQKNRICSNWYKIKIPITKSNKSYFARDYEQDSKFINNAPNHIKQMGSHFRKTFALDIEAALIHTEEQYSLEFDNALDTNEQQKANNRYMARISSIRMIDKGKINKSLRFNRNSTNNRLDTNLTNMAGDLKRFIVGWHDMVYLDLKNSQPVIFNLELNKYYVHASQALKVEIDRYRKATYSGKWYEELMPIYGKDRDSCKEIWMCIAYSKNESYKGYKKPFKEVFPEIYKIIKSLKSTNHKKFSIGLQQIESKIFIDNICKSLVDVGIIPFTVHDALIVQKSEQKEALEIMGRVLNNFLGDRPKISVE